MQIKHTMRMTVALCAVFALTVGVATATAGGDPQKKLCSKGGWQMVYGPGEGVKFIITFTSQRDCVSYVTNGGTLLMRFGSLIDCEEPRRHLHDCGPVLEVQRRVLPGPGPLNCREPTAIRRLYRGRRRRGRRVLRIRNDRRHHGCLVQRPLPLGTSAPRESHRRGGGIVPELSLIHI